MNNILILIFLGFLSSCHGQNNEKHFYLAGWEAEFVGDEECQKFMDTQVIDKNTAMTVYSVIDLVFTNNKLTKAFDIEEGIRTERDLQEAELQFEFRNIQPHVISEIIKADKSLSFLGGEVSLEFTIPEIENSIPFQCLGMLSRSDEAFNWLPSDLYLVAPIYLSFEKLYIDYSDYLSPKILNSAEILQADNAYENVKSDSEIVYDKVYISTVKSNDFGGMGHTGVPNWIQYPDIPTCPKTKKTMKFLVQLRSSVGVKTKRTNVKAENEWNEQYFEDMNFWGDGDLFIFFDVESKIACYMIQNT